MKNLILLFITFLLFNLGFSQEKQMKYSNDSSITYSRDERYAMDSIKIGFFEENNDHSVHTVNQKIWNANQKYSYLTLPYIKSLRFGHDLSELEGKNGYVFEANVDQRFTLLMGRNQGTSFWQSQRLTFDYNFLFRMNNGRSNPILPGNERFGLGYDFKIWDSFSGFPKKTLAYSYKDWLKLRKPLTTYNLNLALHHYSNGQSDVNNEVTASGRNNYLDGNFSTNYFRATLFRTKLNHKIRNDFDFRDLFSVGLGYQMDGQISDQSVFDYANSQIDRYGYHRLLGTIIIKKNYRVKKMVGWAVQNDVDETGSKLNLGLHNRHELTFRTDLELITDSRENLKNYKNNQNELNRLSLVSILNYTSYRFRTLGLFAKYYFGRDYLNIRYDDKISSLVLGLSFSFDKYREPLLGGDFIAKKQFKPLIIK